MKIIITGICGLVGRRIALHLSGQGHKIFGIGRSQCENLDIRLLSGYVSIDLSSEGAVEELKQVIPTDIDLIIHCAAQQPRPGLSFREYRKGNVDTIENIVEWSKSSNVRTIISFSTLAFLDLPLEDGVTITESASANPKNYYALSKWMSESYLRLLENNAGYTVLCFRIPSLVHEEQQGGMVYTYWDSSRQNTDLDIYDNGQFRRNLIYIDSILEVVDMALMKLTNYQGFKLYNIGSKDAWTQLEVAKYIYKRVGATAKILPIDKSSAIRGHWNIDTSKSEEEIGFIPWSTQEILDAYIQNMYREGK
jgi:UDP-glucose 4-epimerase